MESQNDTKAGSCCAAYLDRIWSFKPVSTTRSLSLNPDTLTKNIICYRQIANTLYHRLKYLFWCTGLVKKQFFPEYWLLVGRKPKTRLPALFTLTYWLTTKKILKCGSYFVNRKLVNCSPWGYNYRSSRCQQSLWCRGRRGPAATLRPQRMAEVMEVNFQPPISIKTEWKWKI